MVTYFSRVLGKLTNERGAVLANIQVVVLQAGQDGWEDLAFDDGLGQVHRVFGNLAEYRGHLALKLGIRVTKQRRQVSHGAGINHRLSMLQSVLTGL